MTVEARFMKEKFCTIPPLFLNGEKEALILEIKPYIQPFEHVLAVRELQALLADGDRCTQQQGYWLIHTKYDETYFREKLTYWQRIGRDILTPTDQNIIELSQNGLKDVNGLHHSRRLRYGPHDIHEYRGKFFPQLVRSLITIAHTPTCGVVLDPMCGSGTTLCEAIGFGRSAIGADINPLSVLISRVKASIPLEGKKNFKKNILKWINSFEYKEGTPQQTWSSEDLLYLQNWFDPEAITDLAHILFEINKLPERLYRDFLLVCLSNTVRSVSWQKETDLRVRKLIRTYDKGVAIQQFDDKVRSQIERIHAYLSVLNPSGQIPSLNIQDGNAMEINRLFPEYRGNVDVLITSPPYATALPYLDTDRLSLIVIGILSRKLHKNREAMMIGTREITERQRNTEWDRFQLRKRELPEVVIELIDHIARYYHVKSDMIGFRRRNLPALLAKYFLDMMDAMIAAHGMMRPGSPGYYAVGNNSTEIEGERLEIATDKFLFEIGAIAGWHQEEGISMELLPSRDIFRGNRGSKETILCFKA